MKYVFYPGCTLKTAAGYEESINAVNDALGFSIPQVEDWNCCGATAYFSLDELVALVLPARVMAIAEEMEAEVILTPCNACYATLRKARGILADDEELKGKVNQALAEEGKRYRGRVKIRHLLDFFMEPEIQEQWLQKVTKPLSFLAVAPYYGCQYTRPQVEDEDHPERPSTLDRFLDLLGCRVADFTAKTYCCGAAQMVAHEEACLPLVERILLDARHKDAQIIAAICPLCQFNLEALQDKLNGVEIPVLYFTQLLGLAMEIDEKSLGLKKLLVPFKMAV
jgi:heterodisulfide reductase subunit B